MKIKMILLAIFIVVMTAACNESDDSDNGEENNESSNNSGGVFLPVENLPVRPEGLPEETVEEVIDGDTVELGDGTTVRLTGINSPERDQPFYEEATAYTRSLLEGKTVGVEMDVEPEDQYGRTLAYLWIGDRLASYEIVRAGYANRLSIAPNIKYEVYIEQAEEKAVAEGAGIWQQGETSLAIDYIQYDPPGPDEEKMDEEYVRLYNSSNVEINISGFTVSDDSRNEYTFGDVVVQPNERVTLYTGCGVDTPPSRLYWCADTPVWNNAGDTVYVYNAQGQLLDREVFAGQ